jgi:hypothetical protein
VGQCGAPGGTRRLSRPERLLFPALPEPIFMLHEIGTAADSEVNGLGLAVLRDGGRTAVRAG